MDAHSSYMRIALKDGGDAVVRVGFADWLKALCVLAACLWGHAQFQCSKIDTVAESLRSVSERMAITEIRLSAIADAQTELKSDYKELNAFLRNR